MPNGLGNHFVEWQHDHATAANASDPERLADRRYLTYDADTTRSGGSR